MAADLKPCPFCGGEGRMYFYRDYFAVLCSTCPACLQATRAALGIAPGCNPMESRVVRLFAVLLFVIAVCAVVVR